ncbi:hypothetical protein J6590_016176 [Homalodisca vitripennis]|nr:hypothetical protein J6590_016176 [Homalodisca vitripennis]
MGQFFFKEKRRRISHAKQDKRLTLTSDLVRQASRRLLAQTSPNILQTSKGDDDKPPPGSSNAITDYHTTQKQNRTDGNGNNGWETHSGTGIAGQTATQRGAARKTGFESFYSRCPPPLNILPPPPPRTLSGHGDEKEFDRRSSGHRLGETDAYDLKQPIYNTVVCSELYKAVACPQFEFERVRGAKNVCRQRISETASGELPGKIGRGLDDGKKDESMKRR